MSHDIDVEAIIATGKIISFPFVMTSACTSQQLRKRKMFIRELFNNLNLSQKLFDYLKLNWSFTMFSFPTYNYHFHIHVDTPESATAVAKVWNPKNIESNVKERNEQKTVEKTTKNTDQKPTE
jgi:hypothetical protein